jgi:AbrB family looped-hinge helix DNA binding protein
MATATVTSKGQVTIPKEIRELLGLDSGDRINFVIEDDGRVTFRPATKDIRSLKGIVPKPDKPVTVEDMNATIRDRGRRL